MFFLPKLLPVLMKSQNGRVSGKPSSPMDLGLDIQQKQHQVSGEHISPIPVYGLGLLNLVNKNTGCPVKIGLQINNE